MYELRLPSGIRGALPPPLLIAIVLVPGARSHARTQGARKYAAPTLLSCARSAVRPGCPGAELGVTRVMRRALVCARYTRETSPAMFRAECFFRR